MGGLAERDRRRRVPWPRSNRFESPTSGRDAFHIDSHCIWTALSLASLVRFNLRRDSVPRIVGSAFTQRTRGIRDSLRVSANDKFHTSEALQPPKSVIQGRVGPIAEVSCPHFATSFSSTIRWIHPVISRRGISMASSNELRLPAPTSGTSSQPEEQSEHSTLYQRGSHSARARVFRKRLVALIPDVRDDEADLRLLLLFFLVFSRSVSVESSFPRDPRETRGSLPAACRP